LAALVLVVEKGTISGKTAKEVFSKMYVSGKGPESIIEEEGLRQISDQSELEAIVEQVLLAHPEEVETFRAGKRGLIGFFVGKVMKETKGQANPKVVNELLQKKLPESQ